MGHFQLGVGSEPAEGDIDIVRIEVLGKRSSLNGSRGGDDASGEQNEEQDDGGCDSGR